MISAAEHRERQDRLRRAAEDRGLRGIAAFSRGTPDRAADVRYLTGAVTSQPFVPDLEGHWRAAGHLAAVVPVDGPCTAIVDAEEIQPVADEVVVTADPIAEVARRLPEGPVGVLGSDVLPARWWAALGGDVEPADDLGYALRRAKSPAEQELLRAAGRLGARATAAGLEHAEPGATEAEVAAALMERVVRAGGVVYDVVLSSGAASATLGPSGGTTRRLATGDLLRIDAYGSLDGYLFDLARTTVVGGPSAEQAELIDALRASVEAAIAALRPGTALADVARAAEEALAATPHARRAGVPPHLMGGYWGHGLGLGFEPPWVGLDSTDTVEAGWCLAIERRAAVPGLGGAQHEDDVLVGAGGPELLTV